MLRYLVLWSFRTECGECNREIIFCDEQSITLTQLNAVHGSIRKGKEMEKKNKIIAVDFDGTLCENKWPEIGAANDELIEYLKKRQASGDKIILWTCRVGELLQQAVRFCYNRGLIFDAVNENLPETLEWMNDDSRKIFANEYIDDRSVPIDICREKSSMERWAENEVAIACRRENRTEKMENGITAVPAMKVR